MTDQTYEAAPTGAAAPQKALRKQAILTAALSALAILVIGDQAYMQDLATLAIVYAFIAIGLYLPLALSGQLSLAYNAYFAIGAYAVAMAAPYGVGAVWLALPVAVILAGATALVLGFATRRLSGFHLAVATLMFGTAVQTFLVHSDITGGPAGLGGIPRLSVFGAEIGRTGLVIGGIVLLWIVATLIARFRISTAGIALRAQREVPAAASVLGVPPATLKLAALAAGAGIASLAGVLFALMNQFVLPESFGTKVVFLVLFMPILGGMSTPWGAVLGAVLVVAFTFGFDFFQGPGALTFGLLSLVVLMLAPTGLIGLASDLIKRLRGDKGGARHG